MSMSERFFDELQAINAIFGEETCQIISTSVCKTRLRLRLPAASYESFIPNVIISRRRDQIVRSLKRIVVDSKIAFFADFPAEYPEAMPLVVSFDVSFFEYSNSSMWKIQLALMVSLKEVFRTGDVCIYDWFLKCNPGIHCLRRDGFDWATFSKVASDFNLQEKSWRWATIAKPMHVEDALKLVECTICMDGNFAYQMVEMVCGDIFCLDCFREGWKVAIMAREPFACCNRRVAPNTIQQFVGLDDIQVKQYQKLLVELDTPQPVHCSQPDCSGLLGSMLKFRNEGTTRFTCPECDVHLCILCHSPAHGGDCDVDGLEDVMWNLDIRRCPRCGYATMKNGGCPHMHCKACGADYTWQWELGTVVPWEGW